MRLRCIVSISFAPLVLLFSFLPACSYELKGEAILEGRYFFQTPLFMEQEQHNGSLAVRGEYYHEFGSSFSMIILPFARIDSADSQRSHADLRELNFLFLGKDWELKAGISKVFWGATEFVHLVDIINQTDLVEDVYGEEKLGQPMLQASFIRDWGVIDGFILPFFRERTFPGAAGRLRPARVVETGKAIYESSAGQHHVDFALRYSNSVGNLDWGIYQFIGTGREPMLKEKEGFRGSVGSFFVPYYPQISQAGFDIQVVYGTWLLKGEALYRTGQGRSFAAATCGFEYTLYGAFNTAMDIGFIGEYVFDDRETKSTVYDNDLMFGLRLSFNNMEGSEILTGIIKDMNHSSTMLSLEAGQRVGESVKIKISSGFFSNMSKTDPAYALETDDYLKIEVVFYL